MKMRLFQYTLVALLFILANILIDYTQQTLPSFYKVNGVVGDELSKLAPIALSKWPLGNYLPAFALLFGIIGGITLSYINRPDFWKMFALSKEGLKRMLIGIIAGFFIMFFIRIGFGDLFKFWRFQAGIFVMEPAHIMLWLYTILSVFVFRRYIK